MKRQPYEGFVEVGQGPDGKMGFFLDSSLVRTKNNRVGLNLGPRSAVYVDDNGVNVRVGDGLEVTTGSPVAVRAAPTPIAQELNVVRAKITRQQETLNLKADLSLLDSKASTSAATPSTAGLVKQSAACPDTSGTVTGLSYGTVVLLADAIAALAAVKTALNAEIAQRAQLQSDLNALKAAMRTAGQLGT